MKYFNKVLNLPSIHDISLMSAGMIWAGEDNADFGLHLKKKISRYCLLSWALCLTNISRPFKETYPDSKSFLKKKLLSPDELAALKEGGGPEQLGTDQWWVPLNWASRLINEAEKDKKSIPNDHKDIVKRINEFNGKLQNLVKFGENRLPGVFKQSVFVSVWAWMLAGLIANQDPDHITSLTSGGDLWILLIKAFPLINLVMYLALYSGMRVTAHLINPFGYDPDHDIKLDQVLDFNIWQASIHLKSVEFILNNN